MTTAKSVSWITEKIDLSADSLSDKQQVFLQHYLGTDKKCFGLSAKKRDLILRQAKSLSSSETIELINYCFASKIFDYFNFAGRLLSQSPSVKSQLTESDLKTWILRTQGWAEIDSICQSLFSADEIIAFWPKWQKIILDFSKDEHIQLRRASLVLQTKSVKQSDDTRLRQLAFITIERLKREHEILVTKAVSWLLRSLATQDSASVKQYLETNKNSLPAIAYRETIRKITTGKK